MNNSMISSFQDALKKCYTSEFTDSASYDELTEIYKNAANVIREFSMARQFNSLLSAPNAYHVDDLLIRAVESDSLFGTKRALQLGGNPNCTPTLDSRPAPYINILSQDSVSPMLTAKKQFNLDILNVLKNPNASFDYNNETPGKNYSEALCSLLKKLYSSDFSDKKAYEELQNLESEARQITEHYALARKIHAYVDNSSSQDINEILHSAIDVSSIPGVKWTLQHGADVSNKVDKVTAMERAVAYRPNLAVLELLAQKRYDFSAPIESCEGTYSNLLAYTTYFATNIDHDIFKFVLDHSTKEDIQKAGRAYTVLRSNPSYILAGSELRNDEEHQAVLQPILHSLCSASSKYTADYKGSDINKDIVALLDAGYDIRTKDENGAEAVNFAVANSRLSTVLEFQKRGVSLNERGIDGKTYYSWFFNEDGSFKDFSYGHYNKGVRPEEESDQTWHTMENGVEKTYTEKQFSRMSLDKRNELLQEIYDLHISNEQKRMQNLAKSGRNAR